MTASRVPRILVAGAGVGGLEAVLALRDAAGELVDIDLIAPEDTFTYRAMAVAEPFGYARARTVPLARLCRELRVRHVRDTVRSVEMDGRRVRLAGGGVLDGDALILAAGAHPVPWRVDAVNFAGPAAVPEMRGLLQRIDDGEVGSVAFVAPPGATWTLPLYELALLTAAWCSDNHVSRLRLTVVSAEDEPLAAFGPAAVRVVRGLLADRGVAWSAVEPTADAVVTLPRLEPPALGGLPDGFIAVDDRCRVEDLTGVFAVGDATDTEIRQGGLAAQMADVAAAGAAHHLSLGTLPEPFAPVLRGLLLTGVAPAFLRAGGARGPAAGFEALWWPPTKVAGRLLGSYLAGAATVGAREPLIDRPASRAPAAREDRRALAITMARADAAAGDLRSALRWLQTLEWLDGALDADLAALRRRWQGQAATTTSS